MPVVTTTYSTDGLTATTSETVLGQEVSRRYWVKSADGSQIQDIVCTVPGAAIDATSNLVTTTYYVVGGAIRW